jgi:phosphate-selective porin OprO/OprP
MIALTASCAPALASDTAAQIRLLKQRLRQLESKVAQQDKGTRNANNIANRAIAKSGAHAPPPVFVSFKNGLFVETEDHAYSFNPTSPTGVDFCDFWRDFVG